MYTLTEMFINIQYEGNAVILLVVCDKMDHKGLQLLLITFQRYLMVGFPEEMVQLCVYPSCKFI